MNVLGFDTSTAATSVCVLRSDGEAFESDPDPQRLLEPPAHTRELMPGIDRTLSAAGLGFEDLDALAVGIGPGGFTGLRIGIATAHGIAHGGRVPLHPVLSLAALAGDGHFPLIDAKRNEVYGLDPGTGEPFGGSIEQAIALAPEGSLAVGDGSIRFRQALESAGISVAPADSGLHVVRGLAICKLASTVQPAPPEAVVPCYLRAPDAKPPSRSGG